MNVQLEVKDVNGEVHTSDVVEWTQEAYEFIHDQLRHWPDLYHITMLIAGQEVIFNPKQLISAKILVQVAPEVPAGNGVQVS